MNMGEPDFVKVLVAKSSDHSLGWTSFIRWGMDRDEFLRNRFLFVFFFKGYAKPWEETKTSQNKSADTS